VAIETSATELPSQIQQLLDQREQHLDSIRQIDAMLAKVNAALGHDSAASTTPRPLASSAPASPRTTRSTGKKRQRSKFGVSTAQLVMAFVKANGTPTTQAIMQHLAGEGRTASSGSNALSTLAKAGKLKRTPLGKGLPGSIYALP
jgi:hypothetical protein